MFARHITLIAAIVLALGACAHSPRAVESARSVSPTPRWTATLATPAYDTVTSSAEMRALMSTPITGTAALTPMNGDTTFAATISVAGARPGEVYPWYVHIGKCDTQRGVVGELNMYPPITAGPDGTGTARATIPFPLPNDATWSVSVFPSPSQLETAVACGDLTKK